MCEVERAKVELKRFPDVEDLLTEIYKMKPNKFWSGIHSRAAALMGGTFNNPFD